MNADGSGPDPTHQQPGDDTDPAWSPDGTKIAFASNRDDGNDEIYTMNADGTGQTSLTNNPAADDEPAWSPDGTKIAFTSDRRRQRRDLHDERRRHAAQTKLTNNAAADSTPAWSPDGTKIAFVERPRRQRRDLRDERRRQRARRGSPTTRRSTASPPGRRTAPRSRSRASRDGNAEIYTMNADGSGPTQAHQQPGDRRRSPRLVAGRHQDRVHRATARRATSRSTR